MRSIIFDTAGEELTGDGDQVGLARSRRAAGAGAIADAVRYLGFVRVLQLRDALMIEFRPGVASPLAMISAYYEIADRDPKRLVLAIRSSPDRFELYCEVAKARRRIAELVNPRLA